MALAASLIVRGDTPDDATEVAVRSRAAAMREATARGDVGVSAVYRRPSGSGSLTREGGGTIAF